MAAGTFDETRPPHGREQLPFLWLQRRHFRVHVNDGVVFASPGERKVTDPMYRGAEGAKLKFTLTMPKTNSLSFVAVENEWRGYRGQRRTFVCEREIKGDDKEQPVVLEAKDFTSADGPLKSWSEVDQLGICAHFAERAKATKGPPAWNGSAPKFVRLEWI